MRKSLLAALFGCCLWCTGAAQVAQAAQPLDDSELSNVSGGDGVSFAMHYSLNDPNLPNPVTDSRIMFGFTVDGNKNYMVIKNMRGTIDLFGVNVSAQSRPDGGGDYLAVTLPEYVKFTNYGYESFSVQSDPLGPVTDSLGRVNINGTISMQGQFRMWAH